MGHHSKAVLLALLWYVWKDWQMAGAHDCPDIDHNANGNIWNNLTKSCQDSSPESLL